jgi:hypothetical protein
MRRTGTQPVSGFTGGDALTVSVANIVNVGAVVGDEVITLTTPRAGRTRMRLRNSSTGEVASGTFTLTVGDRTTEPLTAATLSSRQFYDQLVYLFDLDDAEPVETAGTLESDYGTTVTGANLSVFRYQGSEGAPNFSGTWVFYYNDFVYETLTGDFANLSSDNLQTDIVVTTTQRAASYLTVPPGAAFALVEAKSREYVATVGSASVVTSEYARYVLTAPWPTSERGYDLYNLDAVLLSSEYLAGFVAIGLPGNTSIPVQDVKLYVTYFAEG